MIPNPSDDEPEGRNVGELLRLIDMQQSVLVSVSTGGQRIQDVNDGYIERRRKLRAGLSAIRLEEPFRFSDLWEWYGYYSADLPRYQDRRAYLRNLSSDTKETLEHICTGVTVDDDSSDDSVSWQDIEARLQGAKERLSVSRTIDDYQDVGRRCREILIDVASIVFDESMVDSNQEEEVPKAGDAKNRLYYAARSLMPGQPHEEWRSLVRAAWALANKLTHSSSINDVDAFASVQATVLLLRVFQKVADV